MAVLRARKEAIGWNLSDPKGIDPSLCTHRIFLEEDSRPSREAQRRLNPKVWDIVKDEILKWHNTGIIYPISDSPWVSPVHVVPKKAGITDVSFSCVVKHKYDGQKKFIKPNSQRKDRIIKYWVSIGSIHREQG